MLKQKKIFRLSIILLLLIILPSVNIVYASFDLSKYNYSFDSNNGTGHMPELIVAEGIGVTLPKNCFRRGRYRFGGWFDQHDNLYNDEQYIASPSEALELKAIWTYSTSKIVKSDNRSGGRTFGLTQRNNNRMTLNFIVDTAISDNEYIWTYDNDGVRSGILLRQDCDFAKALLNSDASKRCYEQIKDSEYVKLKGYGLFKIQYKDSIYYVGLDGNGILMTGFCRSNSQTKIMTLGNSVNNKYDNKNEKDKTNKKINVSSGEEATYYLYALDNNCIGLSWNKTITISGVMYSFDENGRVSSIKDWSSTDGVWEYDIANDKWRYYRVDSDGNVEYFVNGMYEIKTNDNLCRYVFDKEGNMLVGIQNYNGQYFYMKEQGVYVGSIQT